MSEDNTANTNIEETEKPVKATPKKAKKEANPQEDFLTNFNWHQYQEGIDELDEKQINDKSVKLESIEKEIKSRDNIDSTRKIAPLKKAHDAFKIDVTHLTIDQVFEKILHKINSK